VCMVHIMLSNAEFIYIWNPDLDQLRQCLRSDQPVVFLGQTEWDYQHTVFGSDPVPVFQQILAHNRALGCQTVVVSAGVRTDSEPDVLFCGWPSYFCFNTAEQLRWSAVTVPDQNPVRAFVSLNRHAHWHRCVALDLFAGAGFLDQQSISWRSVGGLPAPADYQWRWASDTVRCLTERCHPFSQVVPPAEWSQCCVALVTESTVSQVFLTEKTCVPLALGMPFVVYGATGFVGLLRQLGFISYQRLADPDQYDHISNLYQRFSRLTDQISWVSTLSQPELADLRLQLLPSIQHNQRRFGQIVADAGQVPELLWQLFFNNIQKFWCADQYTAQNILMPLVFNPVNQAYFQKLLNNSDKLSEIQQQLIRIQQGG
jgi:hypothetical protein